MAMDQAQRKGWHRHPITLSTVVSVLAICGVVLPVGGAMMSPWLVGYLSTAMAGEITKQVKAQVAPSNAGLKVIIESNIAQLEDDISQLEYRRQTAPLKWTAEDAQILTNKVRRMKAQQEALEAMKSAESMR